MEFCVWMIIILGLSAFSIVLYLIIARRRWKDENQLIHCIKSLNSLQQNSSKVQFSSKRIQRAWDCVKLLSLTAKQRHESETTFGEVLTLSSQVAVIADEKEQAAEKILEVVKTTGPEVSAVAVLGRNENTGCPNIVACSGLPQSRIENYLLSEFTLLFSGDPSIDNGWGYRVPQKHTWGSLEVFNIGLTLVVPLRDATGIVGGIWIGFKKGAKGLSAERELFVQAVAQHAAASFYVAKSVQENKKTSKLQRDLILGMSHDLRAPGNTALCCIRALLIGERGKLSQEQHIDLAIVERCLEEQLETLSDLFECVKHQKGSITPIINSINLPSCISNTLETAAIDATRQGLEFSQESIPSIRLLSNPKDIKRVVGNLVSNAIKYTDKGHVSIRYKELKSHVEIIVKDTGIGVPTDVNIEDLFVQFNRCSNALDRQGAGIGLAVCKILAEKNGGYVFYRKNEKGGSIFGAGFPKAKEESKTQLSLSIGTDDLVLVVDDDIPTRKTIVRYLKSACHNIVEASSNAEAVVHLSRNSVELVVTDYNLDDGTADSIVENFCERGPVVICSGTTSLLERVPKLNRHGVVVIEKPVSREDLVLAMSEAVTAYNEQQINVKICGDMHV